MSENTDQGIRQHLLASLQGGQAFDTFDQLVGEVPADKRFEPASPKGRSAWQIVEHMRITLTDLADYIENEDGSYKEMNWPDDYWPKTPGPGDWDKTIQEFKKANDRLEGLLMDTKRDLLKPFPWGEGHTLLREILLAIEHNAYHLGELVELTDALR